MIPNTQNSCIVSRGLNDLAVGLRDREASDVREYVLTERISAVREQWFQRRWEPALRAQHRYAPTTRCGSLAAAG